MVRDVAAGLIALVLFLGPPLALICGSVIFAARSVLLYDEQLKRGIKASAVAIVTLVIIAVATHADTHHDEAMAYLRVVGLVAGALLLFGMGPVVPRLLSGAARFAARSPAPLRRAIRDVTRPLGRSSAWIAVTMNATALAIALLTIAFAVMTQHRSEYTPALRPGALRVRDFGTHQAAVRAAIARELPGVPVAERDWSAASVHVTDGDIEAVPTYIGDEALLRYLTGDFSTPYDPGEAVVVTATARAGGHVLIEPSRHYDRPRTYPPDLTIPATTIASAHPRIEAVFVPAAVLRQGGFEVEPDELIIDPSLHRTSEAERERLDSRLGDVATAYLEQGYQPSTIWVGVTAAAILLALISALMAAHPRRSHPYREYLPPPAGDLPPARPRRDAAARAALCAVCGGLLGGAAGLVIGATLRWPVTMTIGWLLWSRPRVPIGIPWRFVWALLLGLPALAAAIAALLARRRPGPAPSSGG
jgi:hypothetical protein